MLFPYTLRQSVTPNSSVRLGPLFIGWAFLFLVAWQWLRPTVFPGPLDTVLAIPELLNNGFIDDLWASLTVCLEALCLSALIGLPIAYLSRVPVIAPLAATIAKLRFVGSAVFYLPLILTLESGHQVKVGLLMLGELFYLVTTMIGVVQTIPDSRWDDALTLRMSKWKSVWYVVVRGTVPEALSAIRDNAAIGWSMLMFVEGVVRSEGGVGVIIMNAQKHVNYDEFFGATALIVLVGISQDWLLSMIRKVVCPYAI